MQYFVVNYTETLKNYNQLSLKFHINLHDYLNLSKFDVHA